MPFSPISRSTCFTIQRPAWELKYQVLPLRFALKKSQVAAIFSGVHTTSWDSAGTSFVPASTRLNCAAGVNQVLDHPTADRYLNPAAFAQPALGTYGNMGAYNLPVAGSVIVNVAVTRTFKIRETKNLQFRFEAFNLPNHVNPGPPNGISGNGTQGGGNGFSTPTAAINNPNFGRILSADDPRILQGALKFVF